MLNQIEKTRENGEDLPAYAWPGGYPIYYITKDCGVLCAGPECANGPEARQADSECPDDDQWLVIAADVHWEGEPMVCDHCGSEIESAYGDPDEEEVEAND